MLHAALLLALAQDAALLQGPFIGHTQPDAVHVWARAGAPGRYTLTLTGPGGVTAEVEATAGPEQDACMVFRATELAPGTSYRYSIRSEAGDAVAAGDDLVLRTAPALDADADVRLMFASCAREDDATASAWRQAAQQDPDVVVLLGDTPYIDRTDLAYQRKRYAEFAAFPPLAELLRTRTWYGTWDDHDFGANDIDGRLEGQPRSRRAFVEYHANGSYGDGERGIYTRFRHGPVEVFVLDTRTFAATEPSPFLTHHASLLGATQWKWLFEGLGSSTAPIKLLACGMIWNGATRPGKQDHWGSYPYEREALFAFLGEKGIAGVTLIGGDIHRSRVLRHASREAAGYDVLELISSPLHDGIIESANAPHPGLIRDMGEPRSFLLVDVSQRAGELASARARFVNAAGDELFALDLAHGH